MINNWVDVVRTCNLAPGKKMDFVSKWLIITRACVFSMTFLSGLIGGVLAAIDGSFFLGRWILVLVGLLLAHAANNMVNDLFDVQAGVDTEDYPRAAYAPHPLLDGLVSRNGLLAAILICNLIDLAIAIYLTRLCGWPVMAFAVAGLLTSVFYVAPPLKLKHRGLGEFAIFLIWGPLMIVGTYYVMAGNVPASVWIASVPYGLAVTVALMGKHLDKADKDRAKGVNTLPVALGQDRALRATQLMVWAFYLVIVGLAAGGGLPWLALVTLVSLPQGTRFLVVLSQPIPATPQEAFTMAEDAIPQDLKNRFDPSLPADEYPLWPLWYVVWAVWWVRQAGAWLVAGLVAQALIQVF
jgi:1,4-dihydroxy-2-naphthoate octaprenyltransferase